MNEKFILTQTMHLGYVKDTFQRGAVIEFIPDRNVLVINGRTFQDTRDIEILKHRSQARPDAPWVVPYSPEALEAIKGVSAHPQAALPPEKRSDAPLPVVRSDEDSHQVIDIRHTQVGRIKNEAKEAARTATKNRDRNGRLEVIKGDQTVEERIAELEGKGDMASVSERVQLKRQKASMPVVHDDSLGMGVGRNEIPMNAGQALPSRSTAEEGRANAEATAAAYKAQVERNRNASGVEVPAEVEGTGTEVVEFEDVMETPQDAAREAAIQEGGVSPSAEEETILDQSVADIEGEDALLDENVELRAENAELKESMATILARLDNLESSAKPAEPVKTERRGRPKGSKDKAPRKAPRRAKKQVAKPSRTPVAAE